MRGAIALEEGSQRRVSARLRNESVQRARARARRPPASPAPRTQQGARVTRRLSPHSEQTPYSLTNPPARAIRVAARCPVDGSIPTVRPRHRSQKKRPRWASKNAETLSLAIIASGPATTPSPLTLRSPIRRLNSRNPRMWIRKIPETRIGVFSLELGRGGRAARAALRPGSDPDGSRSERRRRYSTRRASA